MSAIADYVVLTTISYLLTAVNAQKTGDIRLVSSNHDPRRGKLEVWYDAAGRYGGVCDDSFDTQGAIVVCRQLGFPSSSPTYMSINVPADSLFYLDDVSCIGNEASIAHCSHGQWGSSNCASGEHLFVTCFADPCRNNSCVNGGRCVQVLDAKYRCDCPPGYHGLRCENDTNECLTNNGGCSHACVNTLGSYYCQCPDVELQLGQDNHTCYAEGLHVTCTSHSMEVTFDKQYFPGIHGQYLTLRDTTCPARDTPTQVKVTVPLEGCATHVKNVGNAFVYENHILSHTVPLQGLVTRVRDVNITVRCFYNSNNTAENFYAVDTGQLHFTDHNQGSYQISMNLVHNGSVYHPSNTVPLSVEPGEKLSVKLSLHSNDSHLQVFARNCKATPTQADHNTQQYLVLHNGCSTDPSLTTTNISDVTEEILSLETFKFVGNSSTVYFHCEVLVCNVSDTHSRCHQGCLRPGLVRRNADGVIRRDADGAIRRDADGVIRRDAVGDVRRKAVGAVEDDDGYLSSPKLTAEPIAINNMKAATRKKKSEPAQEGPHDPETGRATMAAGLALLGVVLIMVTVALSIIFKREEEDSIVEKDDDMEKLLNNED